MHGSIKHSHYCKQLKYSDVPYPDYYNYSSMLLATVAIENMHEDAVCVIVRMCYGEESIVTICPVSGQLEM